MEITSHYAELDCPNCGKECEETVGLWDTILARLMIIAICARGAKATCGFCRHKWQITPGVK